MAAGRPLKFGSVEELQKKIDDYFEEETVPTITGLAVALDTNRQTLVNYEAKAEYFDTIKRAKSRVEAAYEQNALTNRTNSTFSIFTLKNNFAWRDKTEQDVKLDLPKPLLGGIANVSDDDGGTEAPKAS